MEVNLHEIWLNQCKKINFKPDVRRYTEGTSTCQDAADQLGCELSHIAKSIIFIGNNDNAIVVITSGSNKVERKKKLKKLLGYKLYQVKHYLIMY
jgi:prolyl-tRNA editing enzyme YbaK/EbsC (Cys-tRNA(Pro) deacylase)